MEFTPSKTEPEKGSKKTKLSTINFYTLLESIPDAAIIHDIDGNVLAMNEPAFSFTGVSHRQMMQYNIFDMARGYIGFDEVSEKWPDVLSGNKQECKWSFINRESNKEIALLISMSPTLWSGKPAIVSVIREHSYQSRYRENLSLFRKNALENEYKFRALFEQSTDGVFITDSSGNYLEANESGYKMLGYSWEEITTKNIRDIILKENLQENPIHLTEMRSGKVVSTERLLVRKDGSVFPAEVSGIMFTDGRMQAIVRDISERRKFENDLILAKEKAEENDRLKTAFLHNMSHEIRTPLNAIMGFADLLPEYFNDPERLKRFTEIIKQRGNDLIDLIDDILDVSRIESGVLTLSPEPCNLSDFFNDLEHEFIEYQSRANKTDIDFKFQISDKLQGLVVEIDSSKIKQILTNLVGNAFKFTAAGRVEIGCHPEEGGMLSFYVSDTGIGIAKELHNSIFSRFFQAEHHNAQVYGGTGLGLSIVSGLVQIMGGNIWLDSEIGKGSTFYFTVPFRNVISYHNETEAPDKESADQPSEMSVLIVEDDFYNAEYLKEVLSDTGFSIFHTSTGLQAIELCSSREIDLILMDIRLPDMTGYEATSRIKQIHPEIKIIAQTAYALPGEKEKALESGCVDYISKPIRRDLLLSKTGAFSKKNLN